MNLQPTVFISSIISEFYDLRGALKYFLGKSGFRVLMSEEPDFGADCDKDSLENCKSRIEVSDYYLLIIGVKPGYEFELSNGTKTTVTLEEFKYFLELKKKGENLNLIAFVRKQAWDYYVNNDVDKMALIQHQFINELVNNSLLDKQIGRWRYTFDKFDDIIQVLETNQNGLFTEANRKKSVYRVYLKQELTQILKTLLIRDKGDGKGIKTIKEAINIPDLKFRDYFKEERIDKDVAIHIIAFIQFFTYKEELLLKINRTFNYISQGEFSYFNAETETYEMPEYIKMTIQTLEIIEKSLINFKRGEHYQKLARMDRDNFFIKEYEYGYVKGQLDDLNLATLKLINLMRCFHNNWNDFAKKDDTFYDYRGAFTDELKTTDIIDFANSYFDK
ncbi:DUF4062 domain-containing protein [Arenibacter sp. BSSL-BM3]|uniref:DUF4062 domain-containing protein n=1 Tax=Arenibacter arenosicollis TaxID=2762274 RepID=A0ABR7QIQ9_9FLAO|nr:DUF4062 domain-containing protein [Arenibacter arenosicollis]MBC8766845.1 DUF4062 domain-containing protein [Arenibacter arenosicollis]